MMDLLIVVFRTIFFYFFVMLAYRLMGKREVGQLGIIDLIVSILIAELVAMSIENFKESIYLTIMPIILLTILEIVLAYIGVKSKRFRNFFGGKPSLIISHGKLNYHEMIAQRYNMDDLLVNLRQNSIRNMDEVEYAILEPNGKLSIFKYMPFKIKGNFPMPLILDGVIQEKSLKQIHKSASWIKTELSKKNLDLKNIFYAFYKSKKIFVIKKTDF